MNLDLNFKGIAKAILLLFAILEIILYSVALSTQPITSGSLMMSVSSLFSALFTTIFVFTFVYIEFRIPLFHLTMEIPFWTLMAMMISGLLFLGCRFVSLISVEYFAYNPNQQCYVTGGTLGAYGRSNALWILMGMILIWESKLPQRKLRQIWSMGKASAPPIINQRDPLLN